MGGDRVLLDSFWCGGARHISDLLLPLVHGQDHFGVDEVVSPVWFVVV